MGKLQIAEKGLLKDGGLCLLVQTFPYEFGLGRSVSMEELQYFPCIEEDGFVTPDVMGQTRSLVLKKQTKPGNCCQDQMILVGESDPLNVLNKEIYISFVPVQVKRKIVPIGSVS